MVTVEELREHRAKEKLAKKLNKGKKLDEEQTQALPNYPYCPRCQMLILSSVPGGRNCRNCGCVLEGITLVGNFKDHQIDKKRLETRGKQKSAIHMKDIKGDVKW